VVAPIVCSAHGTSALRQSTRHHCFYNRPGAGALPLRLPVEKGPRRAHRFLSGCRSPGRSWCTADPPYLHETRRLGARYRFEYTEQDHRELLALLKVLPCPVILSGYPSALYDGDASGELAAPGAAGE